MIVRDRVPCRHLNDFYDGAHGSDVKMCLGHSRKFLDAIYNVIISAYHTVDITTTAFARSPLFSEHLQCIDVFSNTKLTNNCSHFTRSLSF